MAVETIERTIGDANYSVTQLTARRALKLKARLIKMFGASATQLFLTAVEPEEKSKKDMTEEELIDHEKVSPVDRYKIQDLRKNSLVRGIQLLAQNLEPETFESLCVELLQNVRRNGVELTAQVIDIEFAGKLTELYSIILFMLEVNYADFFSKARSTGSQYQGYTEPEVEVESKKTYTYRSEKNLSSGA